MKQTCNSLLRIMPALLILGAVLLAASRAEAYNLTPQSWNTVGLDSNDVTVGPNFFPVGAKVCGGTSGGNVNVYFAWLSSNSYINLRPGSKGDGGSALNVAFGADGCADAFFEAEITRNAAVFDTSRQYKIYIGSDSTPTPRALYAERLISQARNGIGSVSVDGVSVPAGGSMNLVVGNTYQIKLSDWTATQGYSQLSSFLTLSNTYFQILSVSSTYSADNSPYVPDPVYGTGLYADACKWDNDPGSPTYRNCIGGDYKVGGNPVTTTYQVKILSGGGTNLTIHSQVIDFSGASYHYNSDYDASARIANIIDPTATNIAKTFTPATSTVGGVSTLTFTLTNPNAGAVSGLEFTDVFPATPGAMTLYDGVYTNTCGGTLSNNLGVTPLAAGHLGIKLTGATVAANSSCIVQVNVTTAATGAYANTSQNLLVKTLSSTVDTGKYASASLTVSSAPSPPTPPAACTTPQTIAAWNFDALAAGANSTPAYSSKAADVSSATATWTGANCQTPNTSIYSTEFSSTPNSWGQTCYTTATTANATTQAYVNFVVDTSKYGGASISLKAFTINGKWGGTNKLYIYSDPTNGGTGLTSTTTPLRTVSGLPTAWTTYANNAASTGSAYTTFRVNASGSASNPSYSTLYLDDVVISGCPIPLPPTMTKSFATSTVGVGGTSALTFTITNPNACCALTGITFADILPLNSLQGTVSVTNGSPTVTGSGTAFKTQLVANSIIYINKVAYTVSAITSDTVLNLTANYAGTTAGGLTIASGLTLSGAAPSTTCTGGTVTTTTDATTGAPVINLAGGSILAGAGTTCTVTATVKDSIAGPISNVSGAVISTDSGAVISASGVAKASLTAILPPVIDKRFAQNPILSGGTSILTFLVTNPNQNDDLTGVAFSDTFPATMVVATPATYSTSGCGTPTFAPVAGASSFTFTNGTITKGSTCTVRVLITATAAGTNTSGAVSATTAGTGNSATDSLTITPARPEISMFKEIASSNTPSTVWSNYLALPVGDNVYYQFQVQNDGNVPLSSVSVTDNQVNMASCVWKDGDGLALTSPFTLQVGNATNNKDFATCILGPFTATSGSHTNTATADSLYSGTHYTDFDTAIYATTGLTLVKSATQSDFFAAGDVLNYSYRVTNSGSATLNGPVTVTDTKTTVTCPALNTIGNLNNYLEAGEYIDCTASYTVTAADVTAGSVTNTATASTPAGGNIGGATSSTASKTVPRAIPPTVTKSFAAANLSSGGNTNLTVTITNGNVGAKTLTSLFTDTFPSGMTIGTAGNGGTCTGVTATTGAGSFTIANDTSIPSGGCTVIVNVTSSTAGTAINTIAAGALQTSAGSNVADASATVNFYAPPTVTKTFTPASISVGGTSSIVITVTNPAANMGNLTGVSIDDTYTGTLVNNAAGGVVCSGAGSAALTGGVNLGTTVGFNAGTIVPGGTCTITQSVTATATVNNSTTAPAATGPVVVTGAAAGPVTLTVNTLPTINKIFSPATVDIYATSAMTFTLNNTNSGTLTSANFTDTLTGFSVTAPATIGGTCVGVSNSPALAAGATSLNLTVPNLAAGSCTITIPVSASSVGSYSNTTSGITTVQTGATVGLPSNTATLTVVFLPLQVTKSPSVTTASPGDSVTYTIGYGNPNATTKLQSIVVTDSVPLYTSYVSASCGPLPATITTCNVTFTEPPAGVGNGIVTWTLGGTLDAGSSGFVLLTVHIQ